MVAAGYNICVLIQSMHELDIVLASTAGALDKSYSLN